MILLGELFYEQMCGITLGFIMLLA